MNQKDIFQWFKLYFPQYAEHVEAWFPVERNSIRIRQTNKQEFVFTYIGPTDWRFETVKQYKKEKK